MSANIRSLRNGLPPVVGVRRDDLHVGDVVTVESVDVHSTCSWSFADQPPGTTANVTGSEANPSLGSFTVDAVGLFSHPARREFY